MRAVDLADYATVEREIRAARPDIVIHLGALHGPAALVDPSLTSRVNVDATRVMAEACVELGTTDFVLASTAAVYGLAHTSPVDESAALNVSGPYASSKLDAELVLADAASASGMRARALRIFNVYGPGFDGSLVNRLRSSTTAEPVDLRGPDHFVRDYIHGDDVAVALLRATTVADDLGAFATVNVGSGVAMDSRRLVAALRRSHEVHVRELSGEPSYSCADIGRARSIWHFSPRLLD
jgi:UDP-glucose 4-epimerase